MTAFGRKFKKRINIKRKTRKINKSKFRGYMVAANGLKVIRF